MPKDLVKIGWCPASPNGGKQGVDDLLLKGAALEDLESYLKPFSGLELKQGKKPHLAKEAYYGLAGKIVGRILPETEADPAALLTSLLIYCGTYIGPDGAYFVVEGDRHYCKDNAVLVGMTAVGRKGVSQGRIEELMRAVDLPFVIDNQTSGLSTGEGLVNEVRDKRTKINEDGEVEVIDEGVEDKRLLVTEAEFASPLTLMRREGNTLSHIVRNAWDNRQLRFITKSNPVRSTDSHISILGHITENELKMHLTEEKLGGGIANRFMFMLVHRSKILPHGGNPDPVPEEMKRKLKDALQWGREAGEIPLSREPDPVQHHISARELWEEIYGPLSEGEKGLIGSVISRGYAHVRRVATIYAVLDRSPVVEVDHLLAGLAVWQYAEDSARAIFGTLTGNSMEDQILEELEFRGEEGLSKTEISDLFKRNTEAQKINAALKNLLDDGRVVRRTEEGSGRGRKAVRFYLAEI